MVWWPADYLTGVALPSHTCKTAVSEACTYNPRQLRCVLQQRKYRHIASDMLILSADASLVFLWLKITLTAKLPSAGLRLLQSSLC